jgi:DNA-binding CsgD family transcriptional regulator
MKASSEKLVSLIYDCAVNPELWPNTLGVIRDSVEAAYAALNCAATTNGAHPLPSHWIKCNGQADDAWLDRLKVLSHKIPHGAELFNLPVDVSWTPLSQMSEPEFQQSEFYHEWVKPQNLRDFLSLNYLKRSPTNGYLTIPTSAKRAPVTSDNRQLVEKLSPHIRRALLINDLTEQSNLANSICRRLLDKLSVAVFVIGPGRHLQFANSAGEKLLLVGDKISASGGLLQVPKLRGNCSTFNEAIDRALNNNCCESFAGSAVQLIGNDGERAVAYIWPVTRESALEPSHCAVFISQRAKQHPMAIEILRTVFDLSPAEARVCTLIARGDRPAIIAENLGITINTVRSHLAHSFSKTGASDQTALGALVNNLMPPIIEK